MLTINQNEIIKPLTQVARVVPKNTRYTHVLIKGEEGRLSISAGLEVMCEVTLPYDGQPFMIAPDAKKLLSVVKSLPYDSEVTIKEDNQFVTVKSGRSRFKLNMSDDVELIPSFEFDSSDDNVESFVIPDAATLAQYINRVSCAAGKDDVRYYLNGINFEFESHSVKVIATNGHTLAYTDQLEVQTEQPITNGSIILPHEAIAEIVYLCSLHPNKAMRITRNLKSHHMIHVECANTRLKVKTIDGKFSNWRRVADVDLSEFKNTVVDRNGLLSAIQRVSVLSSINRGIEMKIGNGAIDLNCRNEFQETGIETVNTTDGSNADMVIGVNYDYVIDALKRLNDEKVILSVKDNSTSLFIKDESAPKGTATYVIAPMRL